MGRTERRRRAKAVARIASSIAKTGLSPEPELIEVAALIALIKPLVPSKPRAGTSSRIATLLHRLHDKSIANGPAFSELACKKGCHLCCDIFVSATALQIFAIADFLQANSSNLEAEIERLEVAVEAVKGKNIDQRTEERNWCPLLSDGLCSIYPMRPPACRAYCSLSLEACEAGFRGETEDIPIPNYTHLLRGAHDHALWATLHSIGLSSTAYELSHAVLVSLCDPRAEEKWFDGNDVFHEVQVDESGEAAMSSMGGADQFWNCLLAVSKGELPPLGPFYDKFPAWCYE